MKLAAFDFDSTLMDGETLEFLAREIGIEQEVKEITDSAMRGEIDFFESLQKRVALLKGLNVEVVDRVCSNLPMMNGAFETVNELKKQGYRVICFSGGFKNATIPFAQKVGLDAEFSNILHEKDGYLTGLVGGEMMFGSSKGSMLRRLQLISGIDKSNTIAIGDGANDLSMFEYAGTRIAFCAKPILKQNADIIIDKKDLLLILDKVLN